MPARSVCLVTLSLSEAGPGRFGGQVSVTGIYHTIPPPYHALRVCLCLATASSSGTRSGGVGSRLTVCSDSPTGRTLGLMRGGTHRWPRAAGKTHRAMQQRCSR